MASCENSPVAHLLWNSSGNFLSANSAACELFGAATPAEIPDILFRSLSPVQTQSLLDHLKTTLSTSAQAKLELILESQSHPRHLLATSAVVRITDSEPACITCLIDTTPQQATIGRLRDREWSLTNAQRISQFGFWELNLSNPSDSGETSKPTLLYWSDEIYRIFGHQPGAFDVTQDTFYQHVHPGDRSRVRDAIRRCVADGSHYTVEHRIIRPNGEVRYIHEEGEVLPDPTYPGNLRLLGTACDITDRVRAEGEIRRLAARLTATLESISEVFMQFDAEWRLTYLNRAGERLLHRPREEVLGSYLKSIFGDTDHARFHTECLRAVRERVAMELEITFGPVHASYEARAYPLPEGLAIYCRDVTHQKHSDEQLRLLHKCISHLNDIVLITDAPATDALTHKIVFVNDAFTRKTGYRPDEVLGKSPRMLQGPETDRTALDRIHANLKRLRPVREELVNYTKSGRPYWIELEIVPVAEPSGWYSHWVAIERDITERKQAELKLRESEHRARLIARVTNDAIREWDLELDRIEWSDGLEVLFGHDRSGMEPSATSWIQRIHPDDRIRIVESIDALIAGKTNEWTAEYRFERKDQSYAYVVDRAFVIRDANGRGIRLVGGLTDITERQNAAEALRRSQEELEQRVRARTAQLEAANLQLSEFASVVSHDLKAPLRGIGNLADWLAKDYTGKLDARGIELFEMMRDRVRQMHGLVEGILAYTKISQTRIPDQNVNLQRSLHDVVQLIAPPSNVRIELPENCLQIRGIPEQVHQVFQNLIDNSVKFLDKPQGLVQVIATRRPQANCWEFQVADNGPGIPQRHYHRIFQLFQRLNRDSNLDGSGIGLALVKRIIESRGGRIWIQSLEPSGTSFHFTWPDENLLLQHPVDAQSSAASTPSSMGLFVPTPPEIPSDATPSLDDTPLA